MLDTATTSHSLARRTKNAFHNYQVSSSIPKSIDFGFCAINQSSIRQFKIENKNLHPLTYQISDSTFNFFPKGGILPAKSFTTISIEFLPQEAIVVVSTANIQIEDEQDFIMKLSAIGKYPYMTLSTKQLNFDTLLVGKTVTKEVIVKNQSQVGAKFVVEKIEEDEFEDQSFRIDYKEGEIPAKSAFLLKISYSPKVVNLISLTHFKVTCPGGNEQLIECTGIGTGYQVYFNTLSVNFGEVRIGQQTSRLITINNDSELPTHFQLKSQEQNVFWFEKSKGVIQPKQQARIIAYFCPKTTVSYYERVFCIVRNHCVLYLDLIGTCYDLLIKPLPILQSHVDNFRRRVIEGRLSKLDIRYLENSILEGTKSPLKKTAQNLIDQSLSRNINSSYQKLNPSQFQPFNQGNQNENPQQDIEQDTYNQNQNANLIEDIPNQVVLHKEMMQDIRSKNKLIYLSEDLIDFGYCDINLQSGARQLEIFNTLPCKMIILWTILPAPRESFTPTFQVYPQTATVKPYSSYTFEVTFLPHKNCYYYFQHLQFFAIKQNKRKIEELIQEARATKTKNFFKTESKFNKSAVQTDELIPSIQGTVKLVGHSFSIQNQPFIPIMEIQPGIVRFQPCIAGDSVFQTFQMINKTDTPTYFKFQPDPSRIFKLYPNCGCLEGKEFVIITVEFLPKQAKLYSEIISCSLNHNLSNQLHIKMIGFCSEPKLMLQNEGKIYFPPSYTGVYSRQNLRIQNISRIPIEYRIQIPAKYQEEVYIEPRGNRLRPNESTQLTCSFIPFKKKPYRINVPILINNIPDVQQNLIGYHVPGSQKTLLGQQDPQEVTYKMEIVGSGGDGSLKIVPQEVDFGIVKVNFNKKIYVELENFSNCTFYIEFSLKPVKESDKFDQNLNKIINKSFTLDLVQGVSASHSKVEIGITFHPQEVCELELILECIARERAMKGVFLKTKKISNPKCSMRIKGKGSYPSLKIVDVRNDSVSVATLWENFSINQINKELKSQLNEDERKFLNIEQLNFSETQQLMKRLKYYDWNFGYLPIRAPIRPRKIVITLQNVGGTELDWNFKLPSDSQIEVEPWADSGEPTDEENFEKAIIERKIFEIKPRCGHLESGELVDVQLVYSPGNEDEFAFLDKSRSLERKVSEKHFLQVVLEILNGKPLLIHFRGMTLAPMEGLLALKKNFYKFAPVPIGSLLQVTYPIEITNVGSINITYKVEVQELEGIGAITKFNMFDVQNPSGTLNPGERQYLYCRFRPLESKTYFFELKIQVFDLYKQIDELFVKVEGNGYFKKKIQSQISHEELPSQRSLVSPIGSKVFFSIEEIDFGELAPGQSEHRIIILYNLCKSRKLSFRFKPTGLICGDELILDPLSGDLDPDQFIEIKLSLMSNIIPSIYEGEIECLIIWEGEQKQLQVQEGQSNSTAVKPFQKEESNLQEKETLFLRVKKKSLLITEQQSLPYDYNPNDNSSNRHAFEIILQKAISDIINEPQLGTLLEKIDDQPVQLFGNFDDEDPVDISKISENIDNLSQRGLSYNFKDYKNLFMNDEFTNLVDQIMENTFFNIIQETTRKEADLLRVSKTFLTNK